MEHSGPLRDALKKTLVRCQQKTDIRFISAKKEDRHDYEVGFLVHKDIASAVLGCRPVSCRLISIRLRIAPFNITILQVYTPTSGHDDSEDNHFYQQLQETIDQTPKKDILVVQGDWNAKLGRMHRQPVETFVDPTAMSRQMRKVSDF